MLDKRESFGSNSPVRVIRNAVFALVLSACSVGCGSREYIPRSNRPDASVEVKPDSGLDRFIKCVREAVKRSALKDGEVKETGDWNFKECYR